MKVKVWYFAHDDDSGTDAQIFGSEKELQDHMREFIENDLSTDDEDHAEIKALLETDVFEAWQAWYQHVNLHRLIPETYNWDSQELELPLVTELVDACKLLTKAYENGAANGGSMDWSDVDLAHEAALKAIATAEREVAK